MVAGHGGGIAGESCAHGSQKVEQEGEAVQTPVLNDKLPSNRLHFWFLPLPSKPSERWIHQSSHGPDTFIGHHQVES